MPSSAKAQRPAHSRPEQLQRVSNRARRKSAAFDDVWSGSGRRYLSCAAPRRRRGPLEKALWPEFHLHGTRPVCGSRVQHSRRPAPSCPTAKGKSWHRSCHQMSRLLSAGTYQHLCGAKGSGEPCQRCGLGGGSTLSRLHLCVVTFVISRRFCGFGAITLLRSPRVCVAPCMLRTRSRRISNLVCGGAWLLMVMSSSTPVMRASSFLAGTGKACRHWWEPSKRAGVFQLPLRTAPCKLQSASPLCRYRKHSHLAEGR